MTGLTRTDLPTSQKAQLAAAAVAGQAEYGAKTELARRFHVSRPTVYAAGATGSAVPRVLSMARSGVSHHVLPTTV